MVSGLPSATHESLFLSKHWSLDLYGYWADGTQKLRKRTSDSTALKTIQAGLHKYTTCALRHRMLAARQPPQGRV